MASAKNSLIDALDQLVSVDDAEQRWQAAQHLSESMGLSSILVASLDQPARNIHWVNTTMSGQWMEEYLSEGYINVDPHVQQLSRGQKISTVNPGRMHKHDAPGAKAWDLDNGLSNEGFDRMICSRFGTEDVGINVTLGFGAHLTENDLSFDHRLFAALLASTITSPIGSAANVQLGAVEPPRQSVLTTRQREVLTLLAEGFQTARIAERLGLSESAVSLHFAKAREALGAHTREHALALALRQGLLSF